MLKYTIILSLCFVAINGFGQFSVLNSPKSLSFKENYPIKSQYVGEVIFASIGNGVVGDVNWPAYEINDPFNLAKGVIAVQVDGVNHLSVSSSAKTFEMEGARSGESLDVFVAELEAANVPVCDINFNQFSEGVISYRSCFGDQSVPQIKETNNLNPALNQADKQFLQAIGFIHGAAENLANMKKSSNFIVIRLPLADIAKVHGEKSEALAEAKKLTSVAIGKLNRAAQKSGNNEVLFIAIANKESGSRAKREVVPAAPAGKNPYNLAEYYNDDYPAIFNIILWFMVTFGLSLLAICYAIGSMDPGRDSIIYRMTSTRMKKDN